MEHVRRAALVELFGGILLEEAFEQSFSLEFLRRKVFDNLDELLSAELRRGRTEEAARAGLAIFHTHERAIGAIAGLVFLFRGILEQSVSEFLIVFQEQLNSLTVYLFFGAFARKLTLHHQHQILEALVFEAEARHFLMELLGFTGLVEADLVETIRHGFGQL